MSLKSILIILLFVALFLEGGSYFAIPKIQNSTQNLENQFYEHQIKNESKKLPHPYFGYIAIGDSKFEKAEIFELKKSAETFNVGIFGGSVAEMFFDYNKEHGQLAKRLSKLEEVQGKKVRLFNFALGGYRQPQALNIATLYSEGLDLAINIEGHNELLYAFNGQFPIYYPLHIMTQTYFSHPSSYGAIAESLALIKEMDKIKQILSRQAWPQILKLFFSFRLNQMTLKMHEINQQISHQPRVFYKNSQDETWLKRLRLWLKLSCHQQNIQTQTQTRSLFISQPVPFLEGSKPLTEKEKAFVRQLRDLDNYRKVYKNSLSTIKKIQPQSFGLEFVNAARIFEYEKETHYRDGSCHLYDSGNRILTDRIVEQIMSRKLLSRPFQKCQVADLMKAMDNEKNN